MSSCREIQRGQIEIMLKMRPPKVQIAKQVGIARSTLYLELKRGTLTQMNSDLTYRKEYFADTGQKLYKKLRQRFFKSFKSITSDNGSEFEETEEQQMNIVATMFQCHIQRLSNSLNRFKQIIEPNQGNKIPSQKSLGFFNLQEKFFENRKGFCKTFLEGFLWKIFLQIMLNGLKFLKMFAVMSAKYENTKF